MYFLLNLFWHAFLSKNGWDSFDFPSSLSKKFEWEDDSFTSFPGCRRHEFLPIFFLTVNSRSSAYALLEEDLIQLIRETGPKTHTKRGLKTAHSTHGTSSVPETREPRPKLTGRTSYPTKRHSPNTHNLPPLEMRRCASSTQKRLSITHH